MTPLVPRSVTVYCSSSPRVDPSFVAVAREVGTLLGESGRELVYGGGSQGLMGEVARSCRDAGGRVVGIITERLRDAELLDDENHENIVVATMRERKRLLEDRGDAFLILPGGVGTLAIQLAKSLGASTVATTASRAAKLAVFGALFT